MYFNYYLFKFGPIRENPLMFSGAFSTQKGFWLRAFRECGKMGFFRTSLLGHATFRVSLAL